MIIKKVRIDKKREGQFDVKVNLRKYVLKSLNRKYKVLDCFHGNGLIWGEVAKSIDVEMVTGIEINNNLYSNFETIIGDNREVLKHINIDEYNIIDIDSYGNPFEQMNIIFRRSNKQKIIIYTYIVNKMSGVSKHITMLPDAVHICKTIMNEYERDCFDNYLYRHGIKKYNEIVIKRGTEKHYGYFIYNPENDLTRKK